MLLRRDVTLRAVTGVVGAMSATMLVAPKAMWKCVRASEDSGQSS